MEVRTMLNSKWMKGFLYCGIYFVFQIILWKYAQVNACQANYIVFTLIQCLLGFGGILWMVYKEGNARLVMYTGMLLSIGQLIQSIIQEEEAYSAYLYGFLLFMAVFLVGGCLLCFFYKKYFWIMYSPYMKVAICLLLLALILLLRSPLGVEQNSAYLWMRIAGVNVQVSEFFKLLLVFVVAGFLCKKEKTSEWELVLTYVYIFLVSGLCVALLNEFGTGFIMLLTGLILLYLYQNTKISKALILLTIAGGLVIVGCNWYGERLYTQLPQKISSHIFAEEFSAWSVKSELVDMINEYTETLSDEQIKANETQMGFTYNEVCNFLTYDIQQVQVDVAFDGSEKLGKAGENYIHYMTSLMEDSQLREEYRLKFIETRMYQKRVMAAYNKDFEEKHPENVGAVKSLFHKCERAFFRYYLQIIDKLQSKFSGWLETEEERNGHAFQVSNGLAAMSTAKWWGNGPEITKNDEKRIFAYESDMVFSMVVAELGYLMGVFVIVLNLLIFHEIIWVALDTPTLYQQGICIGIGCSWIIQTLFIIGGTCNVLPFAGITLPLISAGGTSLVVCLWTILLVLLISIYPVTGMKYFASRRTSKKKLKRVSTTRNETRMKKNETPKNHEQNQELETEDLFVAQEEVEEEETTDEAAEDDWVNPLAD